MSYEFLDYLEDILDAMEKAELLLVDVTYDWLPTLTYYAEDWLVRLVG